MKTIRHMTHIKNKESIIRKGLFSGCNLGQKDNNYLSFELNPPTDFLKDNIHLLKNKKLQRLGQKQISWEKEDTIVLDFDLSLILQDGIKVCNKRGNKPVTEYLDIKMGLQAYEQFVEWPRDSQIRNLNEVNQFNIFDLIGQFCFIQNQLSLKYLTKESKELLKL